MLALSPLSAARVSCEWQRGGERLGGTPLQRRAAAALPPRIPLQIHRLAAAFTCAKGQGGEVERERKREEGELTTTPHSPNLPGGGGGGVRFCFSHPAGDLNDLGVYKRVSSPAHGGARQSLGPPCALESSKYKCFDSSSVSNQRAKRKRKKGPPPPKCHCLREKISLSTPSLMPARHAGRARTAREKTPAPAGHAPPPWGRVQLTRMKLSGCRPWQAVFFLWVGGRGEKAACTSLSFHSRVLLRSDNLR